MNYIRQLETDLAKTKQLLKETSRQLKTTKVISENCSVAVSCY
jgi:hypothetical protein